MVADVAKKMGAIEPRVREFCSRTLDPLIGGDGFDFIADLGAQMPMRTIGYLLGIPETDQEAIRDSLDAGLRLDDGKAPPAPSLDASSDLFAHYIDWRADHPSDDLMTELLNAELEDETSTRRRLTREEILLYVNLIAGAGNETTTRLIGWTGKVLAEHPDQRAELVGDRDLISRLGGPVAVRAFRVALRPARPFAFGQAFGKPLLCLPGNPASALAAFEEFGWPAILGMLGKPPGLRPAVRAVLGEPLDEVLNRFPEWEVDWDNAKMARTSTVRGWESLPVRTP